MGGLRQDTDIRIGRGDDAGVTEHLLDDLQVRTGGQGQGGGAVAQVVQADRRQAELPDQGVDLLSPAETRLRALAGLRPAWLPAAAQRIAGPRLLIGCASDARTARPMVCTSAADTGSAPEGLR